MKTRISMFFVLLFGACGLAAGQEPRHSPGPEAPFPPGMAAGQQPKHDPVAESLFPPELILQNQKAIGLDEAQKTFIRSEVSKAQGRFTDLQWQMQDAMEAMVASIRQDGADEQQVLGQLDKVLNIEREIKRGQISLMLRIKNKLTPEQQARLRQLRNHGGPPGEPGPR